VGWLERIRSGAPRSSTGEDPQQSAPAIVDRASPGLAALFAGVKPDGSHSFLDFGPASNAHLNLYGPFAHQIRFAGLVPTLPRGDDWTAALRALPPNPEYPYDVVLTWDVLDRLDPRARPGLVQRLVELVAPGARLYAVIDSSGATVRAPVRTTLAGLDRVSVQVVGPPEAAQPALLPAPVERLLRPFTIMHAFTLRSGLREYVAVKT
jgi:hypothetical protein